VLKAYDQFTVDILNLSQHDLPFITEFLRKSPPAERSQPVMERLVSANVRLEPRQTSIPQRFIIREVVERNSGKRIRIGFTGVLSSAESRPGLILTDPVGALTQAVSELKRKADIVVAVLSMKTDEVIKTTHAVKGIDLVIAGNGEIFTPPLRFGETLVVFSPSEARMIGEVRFHRDENGRLRPKERFISVDDVIPDDPEGLEVVEQQRRAAQSAMSQYKMLGGPAGAAVPKEAETAGYRSAQSCSSCHLAQYMKWVNSGHSRAGDALIAKPYEFDASCLSCHGTGFEKAGQSTRHLANVQCEQCHGPGAAHIAKPARGYGKVKNLQSMCAGCHTQQINPAFQLSAAWERIKH
jgi:hypothetical protein